MTKEKAAEQFKIIFILYFALFAGQIIFFLIAFYLVKNESLQANKDIDNIFIVLVPVLGMVMMYSSRMIYNRNISKTDATLPLESKINSYKTFKIIAWAQIEGANFFSLAAFMITTNSLYIYVSLFLMGYFYMLKPSKESFVREMKLSNNESHTVLSR